MGALVAIGRWLLTLAPGYFFNDIVEWFGETFGVDKKSDGKYGVGFVLLIGAVIAAVVWFVVKKILKVKL